MTNNLKPTIGYIALICLVFAGTLVMFTAIGSLFSKSKELPESIKVVATHKTYDIAFALYPFINLENCKYLKGGDEVVDKDSKRVSRLEKNQVGYVCWLNNQERKADNFDIMAYDDKSYIQEFVDIYTSNPSKVRVISDDEKAQTVKSTTSTTTPVLSQKDVCELAKEAYKRYSTTDGLKFKSVYDDLETRIVINCI